MGRGGFGVVYRAVETELDRTVAIKVLTGDFDDRARVRFDRERRAMGSLSGHANIVTVYRSGFTQRDQPFILMEYLAGGTIADRLRREGRLPWPDVVQLGIEIARALGAAHRLGVLHRDVKPGNILLGATGLAKLGTSASPASTGRPRPRVP
ncbi:MAG: serine/threonine-protein kinase [Acidimicrobiales bacterium]